MSSADELTRKLERDLENRLAGLSTNDDTGNADSTSVEKRNEASDKTEDGSDARKESASAGKQNRVADSLIGQGGSAVEPSSETSNVTAKSEQASGEKDEPGDAVSKLNNEATRETKEREQESESSEQGESQTREETHGEDIRTVKAQQDKPLEAESESKGKQASIVSREVQAAGGEDGAAESEASRGQIGETAIEKGEDDSNDNRKDRPGSLSLHSSNFDTIHEGESPVNEANMASPAQQADQTSTAVTSAAVSSDSEANAHSETTDAATRVGKASQGDGPSQSAGSIAPPAPKIPAPVPSLSVPQSDSSPTSQRSPSTPKSGGIKIGKGPPPTTPASEEKPFDFNRFLEQMRHRSAGPVGEYVRSFIKGFTKKPYRTQDQTKLIFDFLDFIAGKMRECDVWAHVSDAEFENATEAMEKLVMNRLYAYTFSPAVRREGKWSVQTDDLERDRVLKQRINLFTWITEEHLDVPNGDHTKGFIDFAIQELLKINHYKAPRDKLICILNCCKVIFGLIRHLSSQENADTFIPVLIFVVLRANPDHLISNVEYIGRFRNQERLSSESGYYLSSLMGAIAFIETMDYTSLSNITQEEFEKNVGEAVQRMSAEPASVESSPAIGQTSPYGSEKGTTNAGGALGSSSEMTPSSSQGGSGDEAARALPIAPMAATLAEDTKAFFQRTGEAARAGLGASFGKPMGALGKFFQEGLDGPRTPSGSQSNPEAGTPARKESPAPSLPASNSARSRMWGLFGVDDDEKSLGEQSPSSRPQQRQASSSYSGATSLSSAPQLTARPNSDFNLGSWSRSFRGDVDEEPQTPVSDELRQGPFSALASQGASQGLAQHGGAPSHPNAPRAQRTRQPMEGYPGVSAAGRRPAPIRKQSVDPYLQDDEGPEDSGVRTPTDDGSFDDPGTPNRAGLLGDASFTSPTTGESRLASHRDRERMQQLDQQRQAKADSASAARSRFSDIGGFLPSFLQETNSPSVGRGGSRDQQGQGQQQELIRGSAGIAPSHSSQHLDENEASAAQAEIDRAHLAAGVETLRSIFPSTEPDVCQMVLEGCQGDVQASIDRLLEMS